MESCECKWRELATRAEKGENPRGSTTDDVECLFSIMRDLAGKHFTLRQAKYTWRKASLEFFKRLDPSFITLHLMTDFMRGRGHILISQVSLKVLVIPGISVYEGKNNPLNYPLVEQHFQYQEQDLQGHNFITFLLNYHHHLSQKEHTLMYTLNILTSRSNILFTQSRFIIR